MIIETWYRHIVKTGTWRIIAFITILITSYIVTGSLAFAGSIAVADWIIKSVLYFVHERAWSKSSYGRKIVKNKKGVVVWFTGLSGAGKTTVADRVAEKLSEKLIPTARLDGDIARRTFSKDLGFSPEDRAENCRRATHVASYLSENNIVLASFISPTRDMRRYVKELCGPNSIIIHLRTPLSVCRERDPKKMYRMLEDGCFKGNPFTGVHPDAPYEIPSNDCSYSLDTSKQTIDESADWVIRRLEQEGILDQM